MIQKFIDAFMEAKPQIMKTLNEVHPDDYEDLLKVAIEAINPEGEKYDRPSAKRIHKINDGDYQGTLVFVIAAPGYQPDDYWVTMVDYGSCSGCDTLEGIRSYEASPPTEKQANEYWTLMLHMIQELKKI